jgi:hypothetical protein
MYTDCLKFKHTDVLGFQDRKNRGVLLDIDEDHPFFILNLLRRMTWE